MQKKSIFIISILVCLFTSYSISYLSATETSAEKLLPYQNYMLSIETRVSDLLSRLTLEEKASLLNSGAAAIPRLGIKPYHYGSEALHGIAGPGNFTVFPQAIALAGTWDPELVTEVTTAISDEAWGAINRDANEKGYPGERFLSFWSPTVNMARDPRWGRTPETYGEDPYLTSRIGVAFVKGLQGNDPKYLKAVSTPKHFAANNEEHNRFRCNAKISERALREYYFPGFEACIKEGGAQSVMGAYNAINGIPCNANEWLLTDVLRGDWGFDGYVVTDCGAVTTMTTRHKYSNNPEEAAAFAINAGVDVECGEGVITDNIINALKRGLVSEAAINQAVSRLLTVRFRLGMFDPPEKIPFTRISPAVIGSYKHMQLARQVSRKSIVLLKNDKVAGKPLLPINENKIKSIAVLGFNAAEIQFGDYSGKPVNPPVSALDGIKNKVGGRIKLNHVPWIPAPILDEYEAIPAVNLKADGGARGLKAEYFLNPSFEGKPVISRTENGVDLSGSNIPSSAVDKGIFSVRWTGKLIPKLTGAHYIYLAAGGEGRVFLDGKLIFSRISKKKKPTIKAGAAMDSYSLDVQGERRQAATAMLDAGKSYDLKVEYIPAKGESVARLEWAIPKGEDIKTRALEMEYIRNSDLIIAVMGLQRPLEHENIDRFEIELPFEQTEYMKQIMNLNPNVVVVLYNGSPIAINWMKEKVPAIVEAWYPGEQGGNAIADVLFGDYNPGGRLPFTFYKSTDDLLPFDDYEVSKGRTYMYFEKQPLFPFGFGLSYTSFQYSGLKIDNKHPKSSDFINVGVDVKNIGGREGDEVVQLYIRDIESSVKQPIKQLKAFKRIHLEKGETQTVSFRLAISDFHFWDVNKGGFVVEPGDFEIQIGASSQDIRLKDVITVSGD